MDEPLKIPDDAGRGVITHKASACIERDVLNDDVDLSKLVALSVPSNSD